MAKPRVLITGAGGFIGSHTARALHYRGYKVIALPRDLLYNPTHLRDFITAHSPKYIIHYAAYGNMGNHTDFNEICSANVLALYNILNCSLSVPYLKFINVSTSSVYGKVRNVMSETDKLNPVSAYGKTKAAGELIASAFADEYGKNIITVRPFSVYGEGEADYRFIPTVINKINSNKPLVLYEGNHDWIYVSDFVRAVIILMEKAKTPTNIYNIGTGIQTPNREIVRLIGEILGKSPKIAQIRPVKNTDSTMWVANINSLILAGFVPNFTLYEGLVRTVKHYGRNNTN